MLSLACKDGASRGDRALKWRNPPTRDVGNVFGSGTDPCRLVGEVARLPGALVEGPIAGRSPESDGLDSRDDARLASAINRVHPLGHTVAADMTDGIKALYAARVLMRCSMPHHIMTCKSKFGKSDNLS